jgi:O-antigen ligase
VAKLSFRSLLEWVIALLVFLYLGSMVLLPDLYNVAPAFLLLISLVGFRYGKVVHALGSKDGFFISIFTGYFLCFVALFLWHGDGASSLDRPSRFFAAAVILTFLLRTRFVPLAMFAGAAIGGIGAGGFAIYQAFVNGASRVTSFDNPIYFGYGALALALVSFCGLVYGLHGRTLRRPWLVLFAFGAAGALLALLLSGTRGGWLALPIPVLVFAWAYRRYILGRPRVLMAFLGVLVIFFGTALSLDSVWKRVDVAVEETHEYFEMDEYKHTSVGARLEMWYAGWLMFSEHPLLGVGDDSFHPALQSLVDEGRVDGKILTFRHFHNQFVDHAAKGGLLALLALLTVLLGPTILFWRYMSSDAPLIRASATLGVSFTLTFLVFNFTQGMFSRNIGVMMYVIVPLLAWTIIRQAEAGDRKTVSGSSGGTY